MLVLIYRPQRDGRLSWPCVAGWLHTEINVRLRHRELNPDTVAHFSRPTNRARRWWTSLIKANALTTTPDHQLFPFPFPLVAQNYSHSHGILMGMGIPILMHTSTSNRRLRLTVDSSHLLEQFDSIAHRDIIRSFSVTSFCSYGNRPMSCCEHRRSQDFVWGALFPKKVDLFLVVAPSK